MDELYVFSRGYIESHLLEKVCRVLDVRLVMGGEYPTEFLEIVNDPELMFTAINGLDGYRCDGAGWMDEDEKWVNWWGWRTRGYKAGYPAVYLHTTRGKDRQDRIVWRGC